MVSLHHPHDTQFGSPLATIVDRPDVEDSNLEQAVVVVAEL